MFHCINRLETLFGSCENKNLQSSNLITHSHHTSVTYFSLISSPRHCMTPSPITIKSLNTSHIVSTGGLHLSLWRPDCLQAQACLQSCSRQNDVVLHDCRQIKKKKKFSPPCIFSGHPTVGQNDIVLADCRRSVPLTLTLHTATTLLTLLPLASLWFI